MVASPFLLPPAPCPTDIAYAFTLLFAQKLSLYKIADKDGLVLFALFASFSSCLSINFLYYLVVVSILFPFPLLVCLTKPQYKDLLCVRALSRSYTCTQLLVFSWSLSTFRFLHTPSRNSPTSSHLNFVYFAGYRK